MRELDLSCLRLQKKYRGHFEIMASIIEAMKDSSVARFSLIKHASTNCSQLDKYLNPLIEMGFIEISIKEDRILYRASEKGLAFLKQYYILQEMLSTSMRPYLRIVTQTTSQLRLRAH